MSAKPEDGKSLHRVETGLPGLDEVLRGGLFAGAVYIVRGAPGAGKTIIANQICFHHAREGRRALFVSLLAESHARMLQHMGTLSFFETDAIPRSLYYVSAFRILEQDGLKGLMDLLRREMRAHQATLLILDGLLAVEETSGSDRAFRKFIHELQAHAATSNCTTLLLTNGSRAEYHPEHTMVDGLIALSDTAIGKRKQRELEVMKFRGSGHLRGRHPYRITDDGAVIYPRIEARYAPRDADAPARRLPLGVDALDRMMEGGPICGTTTMLLGASGTGKTTIGTHFLSRSSAEEPGLHFGFYETPPRLVANARAVGLDLGALVDAGHLEIQWYAPTEQILDQLGGKLIDTVRRRGVKRLFIDGLGGYVAAADLPERVSPFFAALTNELRALGVTTVYTAETDNLVGPTVAVPVEGISAIVENVVLLRFAEFRAQLHRIVSVMKVRGSGFDPRLREFSITDRGIVVSDAPEGAEALLSGFGTERGAAPSPATRSSSSSERAPLGKKPR